VVGSRRGGDRARVLEESGGVAEVGLWRGEKIPARLLSRNWAPRVEEKSLEDEKGRKEAWDIRVGGGYFPIVSSYIWTKRRKMFDRNAHTGAWERNI